MENCSQLENLASSVWSDDSIRQLDATIKIRELVSKEPNPRIAEVIQAGVVPRLVEFLTREDSLQLQFEALCALTNIACGTSKQTKVVIDHGAVPIFVKLLSSQDNDVRDQAAWALGNVAGDSAGFRDVVLAHGALGPLLALLSEHSRLPVLRNATWAATWTLSNICRKPQRPFQQQPPFEQIRPALPVLLQLLQYLRDEEMLIDACWALSYLSDGGNDQVQAVIDSGVCSRLVELLIHPSPSVIVPALRTVGNIVKGDNTQTQHIINLNALSCLCNLLTGDYTEDIKKDVCGIISKITTGNRDQIQAVIEANIVGPLVQLLQHDEFDVKKEAAWAILNAIDHGTHDQIKNIVSQECIKSLCDLLVSPDPKIVTTCLEGLEKILKVGEGEDVNIYAQMMNEAGGLEKIKNLQSNVFEKIKNLLPSDDCNVYLRATNILGRVSTSEENLRGWVLV